MKQHKIPPTVQPVGVARYLSRAWPQMPGWVIRKALREKDVRLNGVRAVADAVVKGGDELHLYIDDHYFGGGLTVLFADERLLVVEKPAGLPVDGDGGSIGEDTLVRRAQAAYPAARLCHRLDTGTGGALLLALDEWMYGQICGAFARGEVRKTYRAVLCGCPRPAEGTLVNYLVKDAATARVTVKAEHSHGAKRAALAYRVLDAAYQGEDGLSRVEIDLQTGRTHQIRVQMAHRGHPVLGDDKYGDRAMNKRYRAARPLLWCVGLRIGGDDPDLHAYRGKTFQSEDQFHIDLRRME